MKRLNDTNSWFVYFAAVVVAIFFIFHPPRTSPEKVIGGDGFGYYAYLPAKFIYNDTALTFNWFNKAFRAHYDSATMPHPTEHFMVAYKNKKINLYYPGQSFLQLPFFLIAHAVAKVLDYPADGYSTPYQMAMGLSALFYTLLGLWFCSKLLFKISGNRGLSILIPLLIFFGTNLFTYSISAGAYTHCYSFCFVTLCFYFTRCFFYEDEHKILSVLAVAFCSLMVLFLRPVNVILLMGLFYFYRPFSIRQLGISDKRSAIAGIVILVLIACVAYYNLHIMYVQTKGFFVDTYTGNKFYFDRWDHVWYNFFGFHQGILWYTPLILLAFTSLFFCFKNPRLLWLLLPVFTMILLYSFWWFWNIINRTLVDLSVIPALLLLFLFQKYPLNRSAGKLLLIMALLCVPFYQLKAYQLRAGILNSFNTYSDYYFKYFFRLRLTSVFPIEPETIVARKGYAYGFETGNDYYITDKNKFRGNRSATLNEHIDYCCTQKFKLPFTGDKDFKKIRVSFWYYRTKELDNMHLAFVFENGKSAPRYEAFYIDGGNSLTEQWDYKEFGTWVLNDTRPGDTFSVYFWNPDQKSEAFIDDLTVEFIVTDGSDEMVMY